MENEEQQRQDKYNQLTSTPVRGLIWRMAVPTIVSMLTTAFYNMADTFFIGRLDMTATAAVGVVFSLMAIIQAVGFFFGHGSGNYISRKLGAKQNADAEKMAAVGFFSAFIAGAVVAALGFLFTVPLARALGAIDEVLPATTEYMRIILIGAPFMTAQLVMNNQLRLQGSAFYAMIGIGTGAALNVGLDPLFIFVFKMGISGAAWATVISQIISFFVLFYCMIKSPAINIKLKNFKPSTEKYRAIIQGGLPSLCRQGLASFAAILLNHAVGDYGTAAIAAMSIVSRITGFAFSALIGFCQGFQPVCGFNYGAKLYGRVKQAFWYCVKTSTIACVIFGVLGIACARPLVSVFCKGNAEVLAVGVSALRYQSASFPLLGFAMVSNMMLQNINRYKSASLLSAARQGLFFLPLIILLPRIMGIVGIYLCQPLADVLTFLIALPITLPVIRKMGKN